LCRSPSVEEEYGVVPTRIIGVVRDSRFRSIREPIDPIMFSWDNGGAGVLLIRHDGTDPQGVRARLGAGVEAPRPDVPFDGEFSEDRIVELYQAEDARAKVFAGSPCSR
jgi:putative ABC transport system permease protein